MKRMKKVRKSVVALCLTVIMVLSAVLSFEPAHAEEVTVATGWLFNLSGTNSLSGMWTHVEYFFQIDEDSQVTFKFMTDSADSLNPSADIYLYECTGTGKRDPRYNLEPYSPFRIKKNATVARCLKAGLYCIDVYGKLSIYNGEISYTLQCKTTPLNDTYGEIVHTEVGNWTEETFGSVPAVPVGKTVKGNFLLQESIDGPTQTYLHSYDWYKFSVNENEPVILQTSTNANQSILYRIYSKDTIQKILTGEKTADDYEVSEKMQRRIPNGYTTFDNYDYQAKSLELAGGDYYVCVSPDYAGSELPNGTYSFAIATDSSREEIEYAEGGYRLLREGKANIKQETSSYSDSWINIIELDRICKITLSFDSDLVSNLALGIRETDYNNPEYPLDGRVIAGPEQSLTPGESKYTIYLDPGVYTLAMSTYAKKGGENRTRNLTLHYEAVPIGENEKKTDPYSSFTCGEKYSVESCEYIESDQLIKGAFAYNFAYDPGNPEYHSAHYYFYSLNEVQPVTVSFKTNIQKGECVITRVDNGALSFFQLDDQFENSEGMDHFVTIDKTYQLPTGTYAFVVVTENDFMQGEYSFTVSQNQQATGGTYLCDTLYLNSGKNTLLAEYDLYFAVHEANDLLNEQTGADKLLLDLEIVDSKLRWFIPSGSLITAVEPASQNNCVEYYVNLTKPGTTMVTANGMVEYFYNAGSVKEPRYVKEKMDVQIRIPVISQYLDVTSSHYEEVKRKQPYYFTPVYWATDKGITAGYTQNGVTGQYFKPENVCTRAQMVSFLWRMAGCPKPQSTPEFRDVHKTDYFYNAVAWAQEKGITGGYADGTFRPQNPCSRAQAVTFLYRYAGQPVTAPGRAYEDVKTGTYYYNAVSWADAVGITGGYSDGTFRPDGKCTRAQMVTFLYRYATKYEPTTKS